MKKIFFVLFLALTSQFAKAQIIIYNSSLNPYQLVQETLLGQGVNITNIKFNGSSTNEISDQIGRFDNGNTTNLGLNKGLILSTGNAIIAMGPNDRSLATLPASNPVEGDADLSILTNNQPIKNVAVLEFDFIPVGNKVSFNFVFASDEYPEFVNDLYNDNFGFFISGPGITGPFTGNAQNIALIPNTSLPVSINNLNNGNSNTGPCEYCQYYVNNENGATLQYDGFTKVIQAKSDVECGKTYHIKLAISNVADNNYDSAVFIEGASFSSSGAILGEDVRICSSNYTIKTGLDPSIIHEWTFNGVVIPSENKPEITINQSGTYGVKAGSNGIACPISDEIKVSFAMVQSPYLFCGTKTANSITFNWLPLGFMDYSISYQIGTNTPVNVGYIGHLHSYTIPNVPHGETVKITVTPLGSPSDCYESSEESCVLDTCILTPTLTLNSGSSVTQQICQGTAIDDIIYTIGGGATNVSITSGNLPGGITTTLVGSTFKISGIPTENGTFNYTLTTSGGCGINASSSGSIVVNQKSIPIFSSIAPICYGESFILPIQSNDGITGTWAPVTNNLETTEYTFTPISGQCATSAKLTVIVNQKAVPLFDLIAPVCEGDLINLPLQSTNGITGIWNPAINNTATTEYTFTPIPQQCANSIKLTVVVNQKSTAIFSAIAPICEGEILLLPFLSNNGISGTWSPQINNTTTTKYTFTPNSGQCANDATLTVTVNTKTIPLFTSIAPICAGENIELPLQSNNGISGTWTPATNNLETIEYTFSPNSGLCASKTKLTVTVHQKPEPKIENGKICIENGTNKLIQPYSLDTKLSNSSYNFEWFLEGIKLENENTSILEAKEVGNYAVIAIDKITNCISEISEAVVSGINTNSGEISIVQSESFSKNSMVTIHVKNALGFFEYQIDNSAFQSSNQFTNISSGKHLIRVKSKDDCTDLSKEVIVIGYPKFFTPNGDNHNDTWNIIGFEEIESDKIFIFDRYGKLLKQLSSREAGWDGTYNGHEMPATDYWFKVLFTENKIEKEFRSHFSLKR